MLSVQTNTGAMVALQNLNKTATKLDKTQLNITTGLKINGPKDDASTFAIAQRMRGEVAGIKAVKIALANGESIANTAISAGKAVADLLTEMKGKVVQANQAGLDSQSQSALHNDFVALRDQLETIVTTAEFNGTNLISSGATNLSVLSTVDGSTISVSAQNLSATGLGIQSAGLTTSSAASNALTAMETAIDRVTERLANLGSVAKRVEIQNEFSTQLIDILKEGIGNLVDADLAEESAQLQALQIQQQLGVQSLAIANAGPQSILGLF